MENFRNKLKALLETSTGQERKALANEMLTLGIVPSQFSDFFQEPKLGRRLAWMITDLAHLDAAYLSKDLSELWHISQTVESFDFKSSFTNYWRYCGVPIAQEPEAINYLLCVLEESSYNTTTKSRALWVMELLIGKNPVLARELEAVLRANYIHYEKGMQQRVHKFLRQKKSELL